MRRDIKVIVFVLLALMIASVPIIGGKEFFEEAKLLSNSKQINSVNPIKEHKESSEAMEEPPVDINDNKAETVTKTKETEEIPKTYEENEILMYSDVGTGTSFNREGFKQLLYDAGLNARKLKDGRLTFEADETRDPLFNEIIILKPFQ